MYKLRLSDDFMSIKTKGEATVANQNEEKKKKKNQEESDVNDSDNEQATGHGSSGGNMGAGQSGKEDLGSEKPSDGPDMGSHKPSNSGSK